MPEMIDAGGYHPTIKKRRLSKFLQTARTQAGLSQPEAVALLGDGWNRSKLARIENCQWVRPNARDVRDLCEAYGIGQETTTALRQLAIDARTRGWWRRYSDIFANDFIGLENDAALIRAFEPLYIPGLFQTPEYVAEVTGAFELPSDEPQRRITARLERQALLDRTDPSPPAMHVVIDEPALLRRFGSLTEHRRQIEHIGGLAERDHITVQVLRLRDGLHPGLTGAFTILDFDDPQDDPVVYIDTEIDNRILEETDEVLRYETVWNKLCAAALTPEASMAYLAELSKTLE